MKQVININFHGQVVPIETSAFDMLKSYTDSLNRFFAQEEGKEEIINDIETRIAELFQERLKKGATCITDDDVQAIINSMGRPEDFETEEPTNTQEQSKASHAATEPITSEGPKRLYRNENDKILGGVCSGLANYFGIDPVIVRVLFAVITIAFGAGVLAYIILWIAVPSTAQTQIGGAQKKLFRDPDDKIIAGVSSGLGNYFGVNPWIARVLFLLPFMTFIFQGSNWGIDDAGDFIRVSFSPGSLLLYIILWIVIPEAATTSEKLAMKGEKVDLNSIKNSVMEELKGVQSRAEKFGKEAQKVAEEKGQQLGADVNQFAKRSSTSLGDIIVIIFKVFGYFIVGVVAFALVVALFSLAVVAVGIFPAKAFLLTDGWQNAYAWGTLIFFIGVPVVGIITWIIRRLTKQKRYSRFLALTFSSLWIIGWLSVVLLVSSVSRDFKSFNTLSEQEVPLANPTVGKLEITANEPGKHIYRTKFLRFEPFEGLDEDTLLVKNVEVKILKSTNDSFRVTRIVRTNGRTRRFADTLAAEINYNVRQLDSMLLLDRGIAITRENKFRNQRVIITIYVPVGKQIRVDRSIGWAHNVRFGGIFNESEWDVQFEDEEDGWRADRDYIMRADGLYTLDGRKANRWEDDDEARVRVKPGRIEVEENGKKVIIDQNGVEVKPVDGGTYRYQPGTVAPSAPTAPAAPTNEVNERERIKDSIRKEKEKLEQQLKQLEQKTEASPEAVSTLLMHVRTPFHIL